MVMNYFLVPHYIAYWLWIQKVNFNLNKGYRIAKITDPMGLIIVIQFQMNCQLFQFCFHFNLHPFAEFLFLGAKAPLGIASVREYVHQKVWNNNKG